LIQLPQPIGFPQAASILGIGAEVAEFALAEEEHKDGSVTFTRLRVFQVSETGPIAEAIAQCVFYCIELMVTAAIGGLIGLIGRRLHQYHRPMGGFLVDPILQFLQLSLADPDISLHEDVSVGPPLLNHFLDPLEAGDTGAYLQIS
jgi:hypothetical protein